MSAPASPFKKVLRVKHMKDKLAMSVASLYNKMNPRSKYYDPTFPRSIRLSAVPGPGGAVGWLESEVDAWIESRQLAATKRHNGSCEQNSTDIRGYLLVVSMQFA